MRIRTISKSIVVAIMVLFFSVPNVANAAPVKRDSKVSVEKSIPVYDINGNLIKVGVNSEEPSDNSVYTTVQKKANEPKYKISMQKTFAKTKEGQALINAKVNAIPKDCKYFIDNEGVAWNFTSAQFINNVYKTKVEVWNNTATKKYFEFNGLLRYIFNDDLLMWSRGTLANHDVWLVIKTTDGTEIGRIFYNVKFRGDDHSISMRNDDTLHPGDEPEEILDSNGNFVKTCNCSSR